jgi:PAS domain S-box-containing protein
MLKEIVKKKLDMTLGSQILADCPSESRHDLLAAGMCASQDGRAVAGGDSAINQPPTTASGAPQDGSVCPSSSHPASAAAALAASGNITTILERTDYGLIASIQAAQRSFVITDPSLPDTPIICASKGFLDLCGYSLEEVLGRNCRFMQSPNADPAQVNQLREGIHKGEDVSACILNMRADGSEFYNQIFVAPLRDSNGNIANYVGVQLEVRPTFVLFVDCLIRDDKKKCK